MRRAPFRLRHEPPANERQTWTDLEERLRRLEGETIEYDLPAALGNAHADVVIRHSLGRVPEEVAIVDEIPADGVSPFKAWEARPSQRTQTTVLLRTDSIAKGDRIILKVR